MTVKIVESTPKQVTCSHCDARLEYTATDTKEGVFRDYTGDSETLRYIVCPNCQNHVTLRRREQ